MKLFFTLIALVMLAGCGATTGLAAHSSVSRFDGSHEVSISPHGTWCGMQGVCTGVGAHWSSAQPDMAFLVVEVIGEYTGIDHAQVRVDGQTFTLTPTPEPTQMSNINTYSMPTLAPATRQSDQYFTAPLSLVRSMASSQHVSLRVFTTNGFIDSTIIEGERQTKAYYALKRFLAQVDLRPHAD